MYKDGRGCPVEMLVFFPLTTLISLFSLTASASSSSLSKHPLLVNSTTLPTFVKMKFNAVASGLVATLVGSAVADKYQYERLEKDNAVSCFSISSSSTRD